MCLDSITQTRFPKSKTVTAYKVAKIRTNARGQIPSIGKRVYVPQFWSKGDNGFSVSGWMHAGGKHRIGDGLSARHIRGYIAGFHAYKIKKEAIREIRGDSGIGNPMAVLQVKLRELTAVGEQWGAKAVVGRQMKIVRSCGVWTGRRKARKA